MMAVYPKLEYFLLLFFCVILRCQSSEFCYSVTYGYFYCCGSCSGTYGLHSCRDGSSYYSYSYYLCDTFWAVGSIVGVVIGSLVGLAILVGVAIFLLCACKTTTAGRRGNVIGPGNQSTGVTVVSTANTNQSYHTGPMHQGPQYHHTPAYQAPGQPMPMYQAQGPHHPMNQGQQQYPPSQPLNIAYPPPPPATSYGPLPPPTYTETSQTKSNPTSD